jgi:hypothetical protein
MAEEESSGDFEVGSWKLILFFLLILAVVRIAHAFASTTAL